jgi:hypothetical protein
MSMIPDRYECTECGGYMVDHFPGGATLSSRCTCGDREALEQEPLDIDDDAIGNPNVND